MIFNTTDTLEKVKMIKAIFFDIDGVNDKLVEYTDFKKRYNLRGNDIIDLSILVRCTISNDARAYMKDDVDIMIDSKYYKTY